MLLAIDAGNTNFVFALLEAGEVQHIWRLETDRGRPEAAYGAWLERQMEVAGYSTEVVDAAIIACVVPDALLHLKQMCGQRFSVRPLVVGEPYTDIGIAIEVDTPDEVGADRLVNAVAAYEETGGAAIVVDFGTATTFDVVGPKGAYLGGVISPGINLSLKALYEAAAKLPLIEVSAPVHGGITGKNTLDAMRSGIFWGYIGLIEGIVTRLKTEQGVPMRVIATGGLAPLFAGHSDVIDDVDQALTVKGLGLIAAKNANNDNNETEPT